MAKVLSAWHTTLLQQLQNLEHENPPRRLTSPPNAAASNAALGPSWLQTIPQPPSPIKVVLKPNALKQQTAHKNAQLSYPPKPPCVVITPLFDVLNGQATEQPL